MTISLSSGTSRNTSPDYLYDARCSLPRREKCTLDAGRSRRIYDAYTRSTHATSHGLHVHSRTYWRVRALCIMDMFAYPTDGIRVHLGARTCTNEASIRACVCARCGNLARNCHEKKYHVEGNPLDEGDAFRPETRSAGRDTRAGPPAG